MTKNRKTWTVAFAGILAACCWTLLMLGALLVFHLIKGASLKEAVAKSPIGSWQGWLIFGAAGLFVAFGAMIAPRLIRRWTSQREE